MKILVVGYEHPMCDKRTKRSVKALSKVFSEVYYQFMVRRQDSFSCSKEFGDNVRLISTYHPGKSKDPIRWLIKWKKFDRKLWNMIDKISPDYVYFHNIPFTIEKLFKLSKSRGIGLIHEAHEIIPDVFFRGILPDFLEKKIKSFVWNRYKVVLSLSDKLIFVSRESAEYVLRKENLEKEYFILPNLAEYITDPKPIGERKKRVVIVGGTERRVPCEYLEALKNAGYCIVTIGKIKTSENCYEGIVNKDFLPYSKMMTEISQSLFSLISFLSSRDKSFKFFSNHVYSLPNKLYDSLAAGTPVLVHSYFKSISKLVREDQVGIIFDNPEDLYRKISEVDEIYYNKMLENIKGNSEKYYWNKKWEEDYLEFLFPFEGR